MIRFEVGKNLQGKEITSIGKYVGVRHIETVLEILKEMQTSAVTWDCQKLTSTWDAALIYLAAQRRKIKNSFHSKCLISSMIRFEVGKNLQGKEITSIGKYVGVIT